MTLPNFLVLGGAKCGTTSLYFYLLNHPDIFLCPKETHYFCHVPGVSENGFPGSNKAKVKRLEDYARLFDGVRGERAVGEVAISYLVSPPAVTNIKQCVPDARLIASLRDPVDRAFSHFLMHCRFGHIRTNEGRAFQSRPSEEEIDTFFQRPDTMYVERSFYHKHLTRYFDAFRPSRIHVCLLADLERDGVGTMQQMYRFLDVDDQHVPNSSVHYNSAHEKGYGPALLILRRSKAFMSFVRRATPSRLQEFLYRKRKEKKSREASLPTVALPPHVRERIMGYLRDDIRRLEDLLDRDLSDWLTI